jgi:hypothetical protein
MLLLLLGLALFSGCATQRADTPLQLSEDRPSLLFYYTEN